MSQGLVVIATDKFIVVFDTSLKVIKSVIAFKIIWKTNYLQAPIINFHIKSFIIVAILRKACNESAGPFLCHYARATQ